MQFSEDGYGLLAGPNTGRHSSVLLEAYHLQEIPPPRLNGAVNAKSGLAETVSVELNMSVSMGINKSNCAFDNGLAVEYSEGVLEVLIPRPVEVNQHNST